MTHVLSVSQCLTGLSNSPGISVVDLLFTVDEDIFTTPGGKMLTFRKLIEMQ